MTELGASERNLLAILAEADEPTDADRERVRALVLQRVATATGLAAATYIAGSAAAGSAAATGAAATGAAATGAAATGAAATGAAATGTAAAAAAPAALASSVTASSAAATGAVASAGAVVATTAAVTWKGAIAAKVAAAVVGMSVASGAGWYAVSQTAAPPSPVAPTVVQAPAAQAPAVAIPSEPEPSVPPAAVAPAPAVDEQKPVVANKPAALEPKADDHLNDEAELIKKVQRAINSGDTGTALSLLQQHATSYPSGVLAQERIGLRAITLCRAGQRDQGVAEATRFLKRNPSSPLAERVNSSCETRP